MDTNNLPQYSIQPMSNGTIVETARELQPVTVEYYRDLASRLRLALALQPTDASGKAAKRFQVQRLIDEWHRNNVLPSLLMIAQDSHNNNRQGLT